jgi:Protein of unknown function (DUF3307)
MFQELILLLAGHALCDYPLQGDFLARGKSWTNPIAGVPWYQCMAAHAAIHGGTVALITRNPLLGIAEFAAHFLIDCGKVGGLYGFNFDQALHVACKLAWLALWAMTQ